MKFERRYRRLVRFCTLGTHAAFVATTATVTAVEGDFIAGLLAGLLAAAVVWGCFQGSIDRLKDLTHIRGGIHGTEETTGRKSRADRTH